MSLLDHGIWWHVYPLGALGAPVHGEHEEGVVHRLNALDPWFDYAIELGCSGLLLGPIFESALHGYDTLDHYRIDRRLGDDADFDRLIEAAHARGIAVVLDGVFNHVSVNHPFVRDDCEGRSAFVRMVDRDGQRIPEAWEGHGGLVNLDHANPEVVDYVTNVMLHWLRRGIAGWRLDVAYAVPTAFWREVIGRVRAEFPDALFIGEVIHGDYAGIVRGSGIDTVTQYELWKAIWSSLRDRNFWELAHGLTRHAEFCETFVPQTFIGNHDVSRIASQVGDAGAVLAAVLLFTLPGMPSIYYGDEQAFRGEKGDGYHADDPLRPPLPATPAGLVPYGAWMHRIYTELIGLRRRNPWLVRGRVHVEAKDLTWITYAVEADGHRLEAKLRLDPTPSATVSIDGAAMFTWS